MIRSWPFVLLVLASAAVAEPLRPAELPPPGYAGLQYVDSKGCMFVRAGSATEVLWVPRVSRQGVPICGNPPSGRRVPVAEEVGVQPVPVPATDGAATAAEAPGGFFVVVGTFVEVENAERAEARLAELDFAVVRGRVQDGTAMLITLYAGPFPDAGTAGSARIKLVELGYREAKLVAP
jgi:hypothetical protein